MSDNKPALAQLALLAGFVALFMPSVFTGLDAHIAGEACKAAGAVPRLQLGGAEAMRALLLDAECGAARAQAADAINQLDVVLYTPAYVAFLVLSARLLSGGWTGLLTRAAMGAAVIAGLFDWVETITQLGVTDGGGAEAAEIDAAATLVLIAANLKYVLLAACAACFAAMAWGGEPRRPVLAALAGVCVLGALALMVSRGALWQALALGFGPFWIALVVLAFQRIRSSARR